MTTTAGAPDPAVGVPPRQRASVSLLLVLGGVVAALWPVAGVPLPASPAFVVLVTSLVACFDVLGAALLVGQFRDTGDRRVLALSWAYLLSLVALLGWAGAFPGVLGDVGPLARAASVAPWLWVAWHTIFPALLAAALLPGPGRWEVPVPEAGRRRLARSSTVGALACGAAVVAGVVALGDRLPEVIRGEDSSALTLIAGPVVLPLVVLATAGAVAGALRRTGPERWAGLAAAASCGDVLLTLASSRRYSVGWYGGRTLTIVAAGVVVVAVLAELRRMRGRMLADGDQLRRLLADAGRLERLQSTLLEHIVEGLLLQDSHGRVMASNPAARSILGIGAAELHGRALHQLRSARRSEGGSWSDDERPTAATVDRGVGLRDRIVGVEVPGADLRWLVVNTAPVLDDAGAVEYVVSSLRDVTAQHVVTQAEQQRARERSDRVAALLEAGGPAIVVQPIVELATGRIVGVEALSRFPDQDARPPDTWFADAVAVGRGRELEIVAIRTALGLLDQLPDDVYLSVNASPATVTSPELLDALVGAPAHRLVLELTEHTAVTDYAVLAPALNRLRWSGVRLAVDDAGSGFASMQHIVNVAPDVIKLDHALVHGVHEHPAKASLAATMVDFARRIGAELVAEGIESAQEQAALEELGVRLGQGFHLGRPAPVSSLAAWPAERLPRH